MTPEFQTLCAAIRQPGETRADAITALYHLWNDGTLTNEEAKAGRKALKHAALNHADGHAMFLLGHFHLSGAGGQRNLEGALSWFRKSAFTGYDLAPSCAGITATMLAEEREPHEAGPLTLQGAGWAMLAYNMENDLHRRTDIWQAITILKNQYGLTDSDLKDALSGIMDEMPKIQ